jgi:hypothetical protein
MNRIEPGTRSDNPETPDRIVRDEVLLCRSTTSGSRGLETPRTYVGVADWATAREIWLPEIAAKAKPINRLA